MGRIGNRDLARLFAQGARRGKAHNMFIEGDVIYSYGHHFPIAMRLPNVRGGYLFTKDRYSHTTAVHKGHVRRAIGDKYVLASTKDLLEVIEMKKGRKR